MPEEHGVTSGCRRSLKVEARRGAPPLIRLFRLPVEVSGAGGRVMAMYACKYYAALRPAEAVALRRKDCRLPERG